MPCLYRIHDRPTAEKLNALAEVLDGVGIRFAKGQVVTAERFNQVLKKVAGTPHANMINEIVLRTQAQAEYAAENYGHFGLNLRRYAHFTSPIRRYADLLVHRALIRGLRLGPDGLRPDDAARFPEWGEHISTTERRAVAAERDAMDRYTVAFMEDKVGTIFPGRITGVTRFGLFVRIEETGAQGLIPMRSLGDDFYIHDEAHHCLVGRRTGRQFTLGDAAAVRLIEAEAVTGGLLFEIAEFAEEAVETGAPRPMHPKTRRFGPVRRGRKDRSRTSKRRR